MDTTIDAVELRIDDVATIGGRRIVATVRIPPNGEAADITIAEARRQEGEREPWRFVFPESEWRRMTALLPGPDINALIEALAAIEHERWADWQRWCHQRGERNPDGSITIPAGLVARWERQIATPYAGLSEPEKERDREQVRRYWSLIEPYLGGRP